ncbi:MULTISPECIES: hypothetical protein [Streptomyces]|uniref:Uncharacterized protein n=1 Tax=Streptomyces edwardsiae TaxID=3075527 RepID=A0ABU2Q593_9ACTN|nr:hypothetical protein [Streptomyces sp. DSM 41636]MDT0398660.1 hypothetical protein [Streptomyces sp. DSM 41636]
MSGRTAGEGRHRGVSLLGQLWRELVTVHPHATAHWGALRAAIGIAVPSAYVLAVGRPEWLGYASFARPHRRAAESAARIT